MAVEIKELVIRAVLQEEPRSKNTKEREISMTPEQMELMVRTCVREVLKILDRKQTK